MKNKFKRPIIALHHDVWLIASCALLVFAMMLFMTAAGAANVCAPAPTSTAKIYVRPSKNDTATINAAIKRLPSGGTLILQNGTFLINSIKSINLKSNMTLQMSPKTILKGIKNGNDLTAIINIDRASNVNIIDGTIIGDRYVHAGDGSHGMGIFISQSKNIVIERTKSNDNQGDGIYVTNKSDKVTLCNVISSNNRRQGISITGGTRISLRGSQFSNTNGTNPECGLDIEPNTGSYVNDVYINASNFINNQICGLVINSHRGKISNILIQNSNVTGNNNKLKYYYNQRGMVFAGEITGLEIYNVRSQGDLYLP